MTRPAVGATRPSGASTPYGRPVIKQPVWKPEIPFYFYTGGLGGASAGLAFAAGAAGNPELARRAWATAVVGLAASPALLIADLGVRSRFLNMLRVFKVTSPMSVGSWLLAAGGAATGIAALHAWTGRLAGAARVCGPAAAVLGMPLSTYTAALIANTAVPAWHEGRYVLPFLFAAGAGASAGAAGVMLVAPRHAGPARRLVVAGSAAEVVTSRLLERRVGGLADAYTSGRAGTLDKATKLLTVGGSTLAATLGRRSRAAAITGGALVTAGAICKRWNVFLAGKQSAADPAHTVVPQRVRLDRGESAGSRPRQPPR